MAYPIIWMVLVTTTNRRTNRNGSRQLQSIHVGGASTADGSRQEGV
eukprot:CAMPEP_0116866706 /NCGR_PEP_ID=MMETSP0418-20121206/26188_1 /TAXON_ID=1158023 /ORGANISM="Astrosyne radiata, Strain 13vi08-1A" /LENGTH=45 /DNA_ID= /DNA_START= /DNA_END= /DNA_ORIENTATION=